MTSISNEYSRYLKSSIMQKLARQAHNEHYQGQTSSATFDEICRYLDNTPISSQDTILDAGCGNGTFALSLAKKYKARLFGIDLSSDLINVASKSAFRQGLSEYCQFNRQDFTKPTNFSAQQFTHILSVGSLYWSPDLESTFSSWNSLQPIDGSLLIFSNLAIKELSVSQKSRISNTSFIPCDPLKALLIKMGYKIDICDNKSTEYINWLNRWCDAMTQNVQAIYAEMGEDKGKTLIQRFNTYLELANNNIVQRIIIQARKVKWL